MFKTPGSFGEIRYCNGCAQHFHDAKGMPRRLRPARQAKAAFFASTVVLNNEWIVLGQVGTLDISARPAACVTIRRCELTWFWRSQRRPAAPSPLFQL